MVSTIPFLYIDIYARCVKNCHFIFAKMRQNALLFPSLFNFNDVLPSFLYLRTKLKGDEYLIMQERVRLFLPSSGELSGH